MIDVVVELRENVEPQDNEQKLPPLAQILETCEKCLSLQSLRRKSLQQGIAPIIT